MTQKVIKNTNSLIMSKDTEPVIKSLLTKKSPGQNGFTGEFCQTFILELIQIFTNSLNKQKRRELFLTHSMSPTLMSSPDTHHKKITDHLYE